VKKLRCCPLEISLNLAKKATFRAFPNARKILLRGISVAKYIVGQERRLVDPPSQVVAGVRTVTTKMNGRCDPTLQRPFGFFTPLNLQIHPLNLLS
jgi:hypothetical protein